MSSVMFNLVLSFSRQVFANIFPSLAKSLPSIHVLWLYYKGHQIMVFCCNAFVPYMCYVGIDKNLELFCLALLNNWNSSNIPSSVWTGCCAVNFLRWTWSLVTRQFSASRSCLSNTPSDSLTTFVILCWLRTPLTRWRHVAVLCILTR